MNCPRAFVSSAYAYRAGTVRFAFAFARNKKGIGGIGDREFFEVSMYKRRAREEGGHACMREKKGNDKGSKAEERSRRGKRSRGERGALQVESNREVGR